MSLVAGRATLALLLALAHTSTRDQHYMKQYFAPETSQEVSTASDAMVVAEWHGSSIRHRGHKFMQRDKLIAEALCS